MAIEQACQEWQSVLPEGRVLTGDALQRYKENCLSLERSIPAVVQPANEDEVIEIVRAAQRHGISLYPISTGHNWGYGTSLPVTENCVIVDLSRMNRITGMDADLGLITIEPGVTQQQLFEYLKAGRHDFLVPTIGAGPTASVFGNALERGFGMTPFEDHFAAATCLRVVLADGSVYQSPLAEMGARAAQGVWRWGVGPYADGLFSQSSLGIVTSMQIALARRPEHTEIYFFTLEDASRLPALVEASRTLLAELPGVLGPLKFINDKQVRMTLQGERVGMGVSEGAAWVGFGVIRTRRILLTSLRRAVRARLRPYVDKLAFMDRARARRVGQISRLLPPRYGSPLKHQAQRILDLLSIVGGEPRGLELPLVYQYVPLPKDQPLDPARDGVGIIWYAPIVPWKADTVLKMAALVENGLRKYGFGEAVSFTTLTSTCSMGVFPIIYRRPQDKDRAHACFAELWKGGMEFGCYPYRLPISAMRSFSETTSPVYWRLVEALKAHLDPKGIMSPGRYSPPKSFQQKQS